MQYSTKFGILTFLYFALAFLIAFYESSILKIILGSVVVTGLALSVTYMYLAIMVELSIDTAKQAKKMMLPGDNLFAEVFNSGLLRVSEHTKESIEASLKLEQELKNGNVVWSLDALKYLIHDPMFPILWICLMCALFCIGFLIHFFVGVYVLVFMILMDVYIAFPSEVKI